MHWKQKSTETPDCSEAASKSRQEQAADSQSVLAAISKMAGAKAPSSILDVGLGTGMLSIEFFEQGHHVSGLVSPAAVGEAQQTMPHVQLIEWDTSDRLLPALDGQFFDVIISANALHGLEGAQKQTLLRLLLKQLAPGGSLMIGDIVFRTQNERETYACSWDEAVQYLVLEELEAAFAGIANCEFTAHSHFSGVIELKPACPFCHPAYDDNQRVVLENEHCQFLQHRYLQGVLEGSGVIVPKQHRSNPFELSAEEWRDTHELLQQAQQLLDASQAPDGYTLGWNVGEASNQSVGHSHLHVIPRFNNEPYAGKGLRHWLKQPENKRPEKESGGL